MEIKTISKIDEKSMITYIRCGMFIINPIVSLIVYAAVTIGLLIMILVGDIKSADFGDTILFSIMFVLLSFLLCYMYFVLPKARWKKVAAAPKGETHLIFTQKAIHITTYVGGERRREGNASYTDLERIKETKEYFFLYVARNQALIVEKSKLQGGTADELKAIFKSYKSLKYKCIAL